MFPIGFFAGVVLIFLGSTAGLGIASLAKWWQHRSQDFPEKKVTTHIVLQSTSIVMWVVFMVFMQPWIAWLTFATITVGQVFGDLLMFSSYRARHRVPKAGSYVAVAKDVFSFFTTHSRTSRHHRRAWMVWNVRSLSVEHAVKGR